jgi:hypothetical protein
MIARTLDWLSVEAKTICMLFLGIIVKAQFLCWTQTDYLTGSIQVLAEIENIIT